MKASNEGKDIEEDKDFQVIANGPCPTDQEDKLDKKDKNEVRFEDSGMMTRSKKRMKESDNNSVSEDEVAPYWMTAEQRENFESIAVYTVEIPAKEQNTPEVDEAEHKDIENLGKFDVFEEVDDCGQERIGSRWGVTQTEKADGQKSQVKCRGVAKGFQEGEKPQSDSPTLLRESLKMYFAVAANQGFKL